MLASALLQIVTSNTHFRGRVHSAQESGPEKPRPHATLNHRNPASRAPCENSRGRMASKSRFALVVVLTWKTMLYAQLFQRLFGGLGAPSLHVLVALPDAFNGFLII